MPSWTAAGSVALACAFAAASLRAQIRPEDVAAAGERWLATDQTAREQLDATVLYLLKEPKLGIAWLAAQLPAAQQQPTTPRSKGVHGLLTHLALEYLRRQRASGITFVGQYDGLLPLQPVVGELLFGWLLATPDWYPHTHRIHLVAPLRDLNAKPPATERVDAIVQIVDNERIEPENLRRGLAALLWQWGTKQYAQAIVARLVATTGEGDGEDRVQTTLELADFHTQLREYKQAAAAHRSAQTLAKSAGVRLRPIAWYSAACVHSLLGDVDRGIAALAACADLLASPDLDESLRLPRAMFDTDPELANLRPHPRWSELVQRACARAPATGKGETPTGR
ncbi:MAG: hypothetical protein WAT39_26535 [Planctomycetota bacterium]